MLEAGVLECFESGQGFQLLGAPKGRGLMKDDQGITSQWPKIEKGNWLRLILLFHLPAYI